MFSVLLLTIPKKSEVNDELDKQIERFIHGYSNRFIPVDLPVDKEEFTRRSKNKEIKTSAGKPADLKSLNFGMFFTDDSEVASSGKLDDPQMHLGTIVNGIGYGWQKYQQL